MTWKGEISEQSLQRFSVYFSTGVMMDNLAKGNTSDIGITGGSTGTISGDWNVDQQWWRDNFRERPYVAADSVFESYEPGYQFGYLAANRYRGRSWNDVEPKLRSDFDNFEGRGQSTWENMQDAIHDAWDRVIGKR